MASTHFTTLLSLLAAFSSLSEARPAVHADVPLLRRQTTGTSLAECLASAKVDTSLPSSATWADDTLAWNSRVTPVPAAVVFPRSEADVSAAIQCAAATNTKVTTLGGNRSFASMGFGRTDGALVLNLVHMKTLQFDPTTNILTYGGPVTISETARYAYLNHSRAIPHGRCPDVGMTGVALGGGFGTLSRLHGTVLDNIVGVRVALANGTVVSATKTENADLLWALSGAGPSFGAVLTIDLETVEPPAHVTAYTIGFPSSVNVTLADSVAALVGAQKWAQSESNDDSLSLRFSLSKSTSMAGFFYGTDAEWATVSASLLSYLPKSMVVTQAQPLDFWPSENLTTPGIAEGSNTSRRYFYIDSVTIPAAHPLTPATAEALFNATTYAPKPADASASGFVDIMSGEYSRGVKADTSAWKHDNNLLLIRWDLRTTAPTVSFAPATLTTVRKNFYGFVDQYKADGGSPGGFPNYRDAEWTVDEMHEYLYGSNWDKLLQVKKEVDPKGLWNTDPQSIPVV